MNPEATAFEDRALLEPMSNTNANGNGGSSSASASAARSARRATPPVRRTAAPAIITDPEASLREQLQDTRATELRADMGTQFVENLELPKRGDLWIPGYRSITDAAAKEFGLAAAFEDDPFEDLPIDEPQPPSGAVDGNTIAAFTDGVTGQQKNDVLNSILLAQLAANVKIDRESQPVEWTKFYRGVLENVGWVVPQFTFRNFKARDVRFTMDKVILQLVQGLLTQQEIDTVMATINAIRSLERGDGRLVIFERNSSENNVGNFQVDQVGVSPQGTLSMKLTAYGFKNQENVTNVLWFSFSGSSTSLQVTKSTLVLNEQVYERLRDPIVAKLGNRAIDYVRGIEI